MLFGFDQSSTAHVEAVALFCLQVKKFLEDVSDKITPLAQKELEHLKQLKVSQSWSHLVACFKRWSFTNVCKSSYASWDSMSDAQVR